MFPREVALEDFEDDSAVTRRDATFDHTGATAQLAFEEIFERYQSMVFNLAYRVLGDREEAQDVSQEVFLSIYKKLSNFRGECSIRTWIYRIAINCASNRHRWWGRLRRRGTVSLDECLAKNPTLFSSVTKTPEEELLAHEHVRRIENSLLKLPVKQRVAVFLRDIEDMTYEEIAETLRVSLGTVKSRIARGREELKKQLYGSAVGVNGGRP